MRSLLMCVLLAASAAVSGQHPAPTPAAQPGAESRQFDFLLGEWRLVVTPRVSGLAAMLHGTPELVGTWRASRTFGGLGIEDELRISDDSGNPNAWIRTLRIFSSREQAWQTASVDAQRARASTGSATWRDDGMWVESRGVDAEGNAYRTRSLFHAITPDAFRVRQDRSHDDGASWDEGVLEMRATRTAPATR
jgi:hypothetical protein